MKYVGIVQEMEKKLARIDLVFSTWIFVWFLLYVATIVEVSPKFALVAAIAQNTVLLWEIWKHRTPNNHIWRFLVLNLFIKILPLVIVWGDQVTLAQVVVLAVLLCMYLGWLALNGTRYDEIYANIVRFYS
jgi:hypothetical protein